MKRYETPVFRVVEFKQDEAIMALTPLSAIQGANGASDFKELTLNS